MTKEIQNIAEIHVSYKPKKLFKSKISNSNDSDKILRTFFPRETIQMQEQFVVLYLNRANEVIGSYILSKGGITGTIADIRLILSVGLKTLASGLILAHNHPSGNLNPSEADIRLTNRVREAAKYMDIVVLDHLILNKNCFYSFADYGVI